MPRYLFPRWTNRVVPVGLVFGLLPLGIFGSAALAYYGTNSNLAVGYTPVQPVEYSHKLHAGDLGIDCRYCHASIERTAAASVPPTETCMNCHSKVRTESIALLPVRESYASDKPIPWVRVHRLPDYVYFDHSAHLTAGVGCTSCHGRVDQMQRVAQVEPLSMSFCLDCHRNPAAALRDKADITKMDWAGPSRATAIGTGIAKVDGRTVQPPLHCSGCHR